jgi:hypothetical protein
VCLDFCLISRAPTASYATVRTTQSGTVGGQPDRNCDLREESNGHTPLQSATAVAIHSKNGVFIASARELGARNWLQVWIHPSQQYARLPA